MAKQKIEDLERRMDYLELSLQQLASQPVGVIYPTNVKSRLDVIEQHLRPKAGTLDFDAHRGFLRYSVHVLPVAPAEFVPHGEHRLSRSWSYEKGDVIKAFTLHGLQRKLERHVNRQLRQRVAVKHCRREAGLGL